MSLPENNPRLRILHIVSGDRWAGAEVQAFMLLRELSKNHDVFAIVLNKGELARRLRDLHIPVTIYDETKLSAWQIFGGIIQTLKSIKPNIIHSHRRKENILGSIANLFSVRAICVRTAHGDSEFKPSGIGKMQVALDSFCGSYFQQAIIAVSEDLRQKLATRFSLEKIFTVVNGIDPKEIIENLQTPDFKQDMPGKKHIGIVGRLDPVKRIDIFLRMAQLLLKIHPDIPWHYNIFGEGKLETEMRQLTATLGIGEKVTFHGHRMDIKNCIYGLDAVVMCSDHEGLPMTALESIAIGTPLIAHSVGGLTNLLCDYPGFLVKEHSPENYAAALDKIIRKGSPKVGYPKNYTIENTSINTCKVYSKLLLE